MHLACFPRGTFSVPPGVRLPRGYTLAYSPRGILPARAHLPVPSGGAFPHGTPCLFPQGNSSRTGTPPRSPRGRLPALYTLLVPPGKRFPYGYAFPYGLPVPVIRAIVPENKTSKRTRNKNSEVENWDHVPPKRITSQHKKACALSLVCYWKNVDDRVC